MLAFKNTLQSADSAAVCFSHSLSLIYTLSLFEQVYERGTNIEQFVTRFLLKESASQIQSLLNSVESAVDAIDEQHCPQGWVIKLWFMVDSGKNLHTIFYPMWLKSQAEYDSGISMLKYWKAIERQQN